MPQAAPTVQFPAIARTLPENRGKYVTGMTALVIPGEKSLPDGRLQGEVRAQGLQVRSEFGGIDLANHPIGGQFAAVRCKEQ